MKLKIQPNNFVNRKIPDGYFKLILDLFQLGNVHLLKVN